MKNLFFFISHLKSYAHLRKLIDIILTALFRDYTFAASAYLLEPCDILYRSQSDYGLGRKVLPKNIAVPLVKVSNKINSKPFME